VISNKSLNHNKNDQESGLGMWPTRLKWKSKAIRLDSHVQNMVTGSVTHGNRGVLKACLRTGFYIELTETLNKSLADQVKRVIIDRAVVILGA
jgi:hypothetical protein